MLYPTNRSFRVANKIRRIPKSTGIKHVLSGGQIKINRLIIIPTRIGGYIIGDIGLIRPNIKTDQRIIGLANNIRRGDVDIDRHPYHAPMSSMINNPHHHIVSRSIKGCDPKIIIYTGINVEGHIPRYRHAHINRAIHRCDIIGIGSQAPPFIRKFRPRKRHIPVIVPPRKRIDIIPPRVGILNNTDALPCSGDQLCINIKIARIDIGKITGLINDIQSHILLIPNIGNTAILHHHRFINRGVGGPS